MHNSSKATYYKLFKNDIDFEEYLDKLNDGDRLIFCKFRTTNHRLIIETGRWSGVNREDRICNLCNQGLVGDEYHYLLECIYFNDERKTYLRDEYCQRPDVNKFNLIMNCHNITELKKICQFIKIIFLSSFLSSLIISSFIILVLHMYHYLSNVIFLMYMYCEHSWFLCIHCILLSLYHLGLREINKLNWIELNYSYRLMAGDTKLSWNH